MRWTLSRLLSLLVSLTILDLVPTSTRALLRQIIPKCSGMSKCPTRECRRKETTSSGGAQPRGRRRISGNWLSKNSWHWLAEMRWIPHRFIFFSTLVPQTVKSVLWHLGRAVRSIYINKSCAHRRVTRDVVWTTTTIISWFPQTLSSTPCRRSCRPSSMKPSSQLSTQMAVGFTILQISQVFLRRRVQAAAVSSLKTMNFVGDFSMETSWRILKERDRKIRTKSYLISSRQPFNDLTSHQTTPKFLRSLEMLPQAGCHHH